MAMAEKKRIIISGGGTGGHIFPAIAIANALKEIAPETEILFVGANGRMEMEKVPAAGYRIIGLDIQGINRKSIWKNLLLPFKLLKSLRKAKDIIREFRPDVVVGVGGYASGPLLMAAGRLKVPYLIQEQNSYAGITNKRLAGKASKICVAFEGMEAFFPTEKIVVTGNPIRSDVVDVEGKDFEADELYGFDHDKKTILVTGGSLGAGTLNKCVELGLEKLKEQEVQVIWQCGSYYYEKLKSALGPRIDDSVQLRPFLNRMDLAYASADLIVARAGAGTIAELCAVGKPCILVPSPNVAEDHQTKNAHALVAQGAAVLITDKLAQEQLINKAIAVLEDKDLQKKLMSNIKRMAKADADKVIATEVLKLATKNE